MHHPRVPLPFSKDAQQGNTSKVFFLVCAAKLSMSELHLVTMATTSRPLDMFTPQASLRFWRYNTYLQSLGLPNTKWPQTVISPRDIDRKQKQLTINNQKWKTWHWNQTKIPKCVRIVSRNDSPSMSRQPAALWLYDIINWNNVSQSVLILNQE